MICTAMMPAFVADEVVTSAERKYKGNTEVCLGDVGLHGLLFLRINIRNEICRRDLKLLERDYSQMEHYLIALKT